MHTCYRDRFRWTIVLTDAALVDDPRVSRVFVHVLAVRHHHAVAVLTGRSENLKTVVTATLKARVALKLWCDVTTVLFAFFAVVGVLCAFVNRCKNNVQYVLTLQSNLENKMHVLKLQG